MDGQEETTGVATAWRPRVGRWAIRARETTSAGYAGIAGSIARPSPGPRIPRRDTRRKHPRRLGDVSWLTFSCLFACHLPNAESGWGLVRSGLALMMVPPKMAAAARKIMLSASKTNGMVSLRV